MKEEEPARFSFNQRRPVKEGRLGTLEGHIFYDPDPLNKGSSVFPDDSMPDHESCQSLA